MDTKPLKIDNGTVLVHITDVCYNHCPWCYLKSQVGANKQHIPFEILERRIRWAVENIDCDTILLIGGEPLLHPDFSRLVQLIIDLGKHPEIVTSGKISNRQYEKDNYQLAINLYSVDLLRIELSYQPGMNDQAYEKMVADIRAHYSLRRTIKKTNGVFVPGNPDLSSTVVLTKDKTKDFETFIKFMELCMTKLFGSGLNPAEIQSYRYHYELFVKNYMPFETSHHSSFSIFTTNNEEFVGKLVFVSEIGVEESCTGNISITKPMSSACPVMQVVKKSDSLVIPEISIRANGDLCFARPECLTVTKGICNADIHTDKETIYRVTLNSLRKVKYENILFFKRLMAQSASEYCLADKEYHSNEDNKSCGSCRFDLSCNACHNPGDGW